MTDIVAYACSTRPNSLWSAAQFNSALPKNRTDCDIPLVSLADYESLRSRAEKAEAQAVRLGELIRDNGTPRFNAVCARAEKAEATCEKLAKALELALDVLTAEDGCDLAPIIGSDNPNEHAAGLAAEALSEYLKEASE